MGAMVSEIFEPERWRTVEGFSFTDITYYRAADSGTVRVAFNRPEVSTATLAREASTTAAREIAALAATSADAAAHLTGMVNAVRTIAAIERTALDRAAKINAKRPTSQRMLKYAFNLIDNGLVGQQV